MPKNSKAPAQKAGPVPDFAPIENEVKKHAEEAKRRDYERYENIEPQQSIGRALLDSSHHELKDAAVTIKKLAEYFSTLKKTAKPAGQGDELDEELSDLNAGKFGYYEYQAKLDKVAELIGQMPPLLEIYADDDTKVNAGEKERASLIEADDYNRIKTLLDRCMENLDGCLIYEESNSLMFRTLYSQIANTTIMLEDMAEGHLLMPLEGETTDPYGKPIHRMTVPDTNIKISAEGLTDAENDYTRLLGLNLKMKTYYIPAEEIPLFAHEPNEEDLSQGYLGDCYMMSTLAAVAKADPARIKDAIKDNRDGTVTVRFYNKAMEPVYVTVQKTVPAMEFSHDPFSKGPLWVKMIEKAFAASLLNADASDKPPKFNNISTYERIDGGVASVFFDAFLGPESKSDKYYTSRLSIPFSKTHGDEYSETELKDFNFINDALNKNRMLVGSTRSAVDYDEIAKVMGIDPLENAVGTAPENQKSISYLGIYQSHGYTITGTTEVDGLKYIILRNPHDKDGLIMDQAGNIKPYENAQGLAYVELRNFRMLFSQVAITGTDLTPLDRLKTEDARNFRKVYGERIMDFARRLKATEHIFNLQFKDSDEFTALNANAKKLVAAMNAEPPVMSAIDKCYRAFIESAEAYRGHRTAPLGRGETVADRKAKDARTRSRNRMDVLTDILRLDDEFKLSQAAAEARRNEPRPVLEDQIARGYDAVEMDASHRITMDILERRIEQNKQILLRETNLKDATMDTVERLARSLRHPRFKELRRMLCGGMPEESAPINTALLQARAYIQAGHTVEELRKTELGANKAVAPYFDLLEQVIREDEAHLQEDKAFANRLISLTFPYDGDIEEDLQDEAGNRQPGQAENAPVQGLAEPIQQNVPVPGQANPAEQNREIPQEEAEKLAAAQAVIDELLQTYNADIETESRRSKWNTNDRKYGLPSFYNKEENDRFSYAVHVKNEDREARKNLSLRAGDVYSQVLAPYMSAIKIAKLMVQNSAMDQERKDGILEFIKNNTKLFMAVLDRGNTPRTALRNLEIADIMTNGTNEQKGAILKAKMQELADSQRNLMILNPTGNMDAVIDRIGQFGGVMTAIGSMGTFLSTYDGQHCGVSVDDIQNFNRQIQNNGTRYSANFNDFLLMLDPVYQYIDVKAGREYLIEFGNAAAGTIKNLNEQIAAAEALPQTPETVRQLNTLRASRKAAVANIIGTLRMAKDVGKANIEQADLVEKVLTDYRHTANGMLVNQNPVFNSLYDSFDPKLLVKEENGEVTLNMKEAETLEKMLDAQTRAEEMSRKYTEDLKKLQARNAAAQQAAQANANQQAPQANANQQAPQANANQGPDPGQGQPVPHI